MRDDVFTVYFTKNGVQHVVVTLPELEPWFTGILKTWAFTDQPTPNDNFPLLITGTRLADKPEK